MHRPTALALVVMLLSPSSAAAGDDDSGGWAEIQTGYVFGVDNTVEALLQSSASTTLFDATVYYRISGFDLGLSVGQIGSGSFVRRRTGKRERMGGQIFVAGMFRWRFASASVVSTYSTLSPGWMGFSHSEAARASIAETEDVEMTTVDHFSGGFGIAFEGGFLFQISKELTAHLGFRTLLGFTDIGAGQDELEYVLSALMVTTGVGVALW